jgi:hypothetical protein
MIIAVKGGEVNKLSDIILEIMQKHATGIKFREKNAGTAIDSKMQNEVY